MPILYIQPGEKVVIRFADKDGNPQDGEFTLEYSSKGTEIKLRESAGLSGNLVGKAEAVLYHEKYIPGKRGAIKAVTSSN